MRLRWWKTTEHAPSYRGRASSLTSGSGGILNSSAADRVFRCVSGSVAVSAYELEALPLPDPAALSGLEELVGAGASREAIDAECSRLYTAE